MRRGGWSYSHSSQPQGPRGRPGRHQTSTKASPRNGCHRGLTVRSLPAPGTCAPAVVARHCRTVGKRSMRPLDCGPRRRSYYVCPTRRQPGALRPVPLAPTRPPPLASRRPQAPTLGGGNGSTQGPDAARESICGPRVGAKAGAGGTKGHRWGGRGLDRARPRGRHDGRARQPAGPAVLPPPGPPPARPRVGLVDVAQLVKCRVGSSGNNPVPGRASAIAA